MNKELRIGNLLRTIKTGRIVTVKEVYTSVILIDADSLVFFNIKYVPRPITHFEPIELTIELLKEYGFKPLCKDWQKGGVILHTRKRGFVINKRVPIMKYTHQLQNYYFSHTGKELL